MDVNGEVVDGGGDREVFRDGIAGEEIERGFGERDGVVYVCDETTPT